MTKHLRRAAFTIVLAGLCARSLYSAEDKTFEQAFKALPAAEELYQEGLKEFAAARYGTSSAAFEKCLQSLPRHAFARYRLAVLCYVRNDLQAALSHMVRALEDLDFMFDLNDYAVKRMSHSLGSYEQMLAEERQNAASCREAREIESLSREVLDAKSKLELQDLGRREARARTEGSFHYFLGNIHFQLRMFPEAMRQYREAIKDSPGLAEAYSNAAAIRFMAGDAPGAFEDLERAEGLGLGDRLNLNLIFLVHEALGRPTEGILREDLAPGGETGVRAIRLALTVKSENILAPPFYENCYVVFSRSSLDAVLIDPGAEDPRIEDLARSLSLKIRAVLITHGHEDHTGAAAHYSRLFRVPVLVHGRDAGRLAEPASGTLADGQALAYEGLSVRVIHTPGHSPGSACFLVGGFLFTGDTLLKGGVGRIESKGPGDPSRSRDGLVLTIKKKLLVLPGSVPVCPGHGRVSTVADEKANNPFLAKWGNGRPARSGLTAGGRC